MPHEANALVFDVASQPMLVGAARERPLPSPVPWVRAGARRHVGRVTYKLAPRAVSRLLQA